MKVWLNGELVDADSALISVDDKGLLVGDGVFETMRAYAGTTFALAEHLERLERSADVLVIALPEPDELKRAVEAVLDANNLQEARVRVTVTSGLGPAGLSRGDGSPTTLVTASALATRPPTVKAILSSWPCNEHSVLAGVKTTSNAENVAKIAHAQAQGVDEAISLNLAGNLCEGTTSNVFVVRGEGVSTPPVSAGCLAGITRDHLIALAPGCGFEIVERDIPETDLRGADEIFLSSSTRELTPLVELDGNPIGNGRVGPVTARLAEAFSAMIRRAA